MRKSRLLLILIIIDGLTLTSPAGAQLATVVSPPIDHPVASPLALRTPYAWKTGAGAWGESFVEETLKLRGFGEVIEIKAPGGQGIDRVALKRDAMGKLTELRFIEVKTHRGQVARLSGTAAGRQLSRTWLAKKLQGMRSSPYLAVRELAREIATFHRGAGVPIERLGELHEINTRTGRYIRRNPLTRRELSNDAVERLVINIGRRTHLPATRDWTSRTLAAWDQIRSASQGAWVRDPGVVAAGLSSQGPLQLLRASRRTTIRPFRRLTRLAGPVGGAVALAAEAGDLYSEFAGYVRGEVSRRQLVATTVRAGGGVFGASAGAAAGAWIGGSGGPIAWVTVPARAGVGGLVGYGAGSSVMNAAADSWYGRIDRSVQAGVDAWLAATSYARLAVGPTNDAER